MITISYLVTASPREICCPLVVIICHYIDERWTKLKLTACFITFTKVKTNDLIIFLVKFLYIIRRLCILFFEAFEELRNVRTDLECKCTAPLLYALGGKSCCKRSWHELNDLVPPFLAHCTTGCLPDKIICDFLNTTFIPHLKLLFYSEENRAQGSNFSKRNE